MRKFLFVLALAAVTLPVSASASPDAKTVRILNAQTENIESAAGNSAHTSMRVGPFNQRAIVYVTANGQSTYRGSIRNAGITLTIVEGDHRIVDDSFEGESANITFSAAASHMFVLPRGATRVVQAMVDPMGEGGVQSNRNTRVHMDLIAIAAH
jgi:hypothetical protein